MSLIEHYVLFNLAYQSAQQLVSTSIDFKRTAPSTGWRTKQQMDYYTSLSYLTDMISACESVNHNTKLAFF